MRRALAVLALALVACGEPAVDVALPERDAGQHVADLAGILDAGTLEERLAAASESTGLDIVALTFETPQASCGEAFRAGGAVVAAWEADIALVAVARPGDFGAAEEPRERCVGVRPADDYALPRAVREDIAEVLVPPIAARNDWDAVFDAAAVRLRQALDSTPRERRRPTDGERTRASSVGTALSAAVGGTVQFDGGAVW